MRMQGKGWARATLPIMIAAGTGFAWGQQAQKPSPLPKVAAAKQPSQSPQPAAIGKPALAAKPVSAPPLAAAANPASAAAAPTPAAGAPAATAPAPAAPAPSIPVITSAAPVIPQAELVWSAVLDADAPDPPMTGSELANLNSVAIAGDRVVALFEARPELSRGAHPLRRFRLLSLDLNTDEAKGQRFVNGQSTPYLFATDDEHLLVDGDSLSRLNPDLTDGGAQFAATENEQVVSISPEGSTMALWTQTGAELLNADTLTLTGAHFTGPAPTANGKDFVLTDDQHWISEFPGDLSFVTLIDASGPHLLYRGSCGGRPEFLSADKILLIECSKATILDRSGAVLKELPLTAPFNRFAGVSRDGSRFAIESSDYPIGDPSYNASQLFTIYNAQSYAPVALVTPDTLPDALSWSAFSKDGSQFVCGSARKLTLYRIP